jgi:hypothetical protein
VADLFTATAPAGLLHHFYRLDLKDREDFEAQIYPDLRLLAKDTVATPAGLERRAAALAVRELLTTRSSATLSALRDELKKNKLIQLSSLELADVMTDVLT